MRQEGVERAIQTALVHLLLRHTENVREGGLPIEMLRDVQFTRRTAEPGDHQHQRHDPPLDVRVPSRNGLLKKVIQSEPVNQLPSQPRSAKLPTVLNADLRDIDLDMLRSCPFFEQRLLSIASGSGLRSLPHAEPLGLVDVTEIGDDSLTRSAFRPDRLHQRPISVPLAVLATNTRTKKHARVVPSSKSQARAKVFTTRPLANQRSTSRPSPNHLCSKPAQKIFESSISPENWRTWANPDQGGRPPQWVAS